MKPFLSLLVLLSFSFGIVSAQKEQAIIYKSLEMPVIDGVEDDLWQFVQPNYIEKNFVGSTPTLNAYWKMVWDDRNIYLLVNVDDDNHWPGWENGTNRWNADNVEIYFDVNELLMDGLGSVDKSGHYQITNGFSKDGSGTVNRLETGYLYNDIGGSCAYQLYNEGYVYEYEIPLASFIDKKGVVLSPLTIQNRDIGFDAVIVDQDEGVTISRQRKVWQNIGTTDECWGNMDDAGILKFKSIDLPEESVICGTNTPTNIKIDASNENIISYDWLLDGGELISKDKNTCRVSWPVEGVKNVILTEVDASGQLFQFAKQFVVYPGFSVSIGDQISICKDEQVEIIPEIVNGIPPFKYYWNDLLGDSTFAEQINSNKSLFLSIIDSVGCMANHSKYIRVLTYIAPDQICKISVEDEDNKNCIEWVKSDNENIHEYQIFKESNVIDKYGLIGTVNYRDTNYFIDENSTPSKYADKYLIKTVDKCGNLSESSSIHKNIHLQISTGMPGFFNLTWTPYTGFEYGSYFIYKGKSLGEMVLVDQISSSSNQYTDTATTKVYYQIAVRRDAPCGESTKKSLIEQTEARSNIELVNRVSNGILKTKTISIYPNPTTGLLNISLPIVSGMSYSVTDLSGKVIRKKPIKEQTIDLSDLRKGQYIVEIFDKQNTFNSFLITKE